MARLIYSNVLVISSTFFRSIWLGDFKLCEQNDQFNGNFTSHINFHWEDISLPF
jgi:hypothetical protein